MSIFLIGRRGSWHFNRYAQKEK